MEKAAKNFFQTFCPWTIQFSTDETPIVHGRRVFKVFRDLIDLRNARKAYLLKQFLWKMLNSINKKTINSEGHQERIISNTNYKYNTRK